MTLKDSTFGAPDNLTYATEEAGGGGITNVTLYVDKDTGDDANGGSGWGDALQNLYTAWELLESTVRGNHTIWVRGDHSITGAPLYGVFGGKTVVGGSITVRGTAEYYGEYTASGGATITADASQPNSDRIVVTGAGWSNNIHVGKYVGADGGLTGGYYGFHQVIKNTTDTLFLSEDHSLSGSEELDFWRATSRITSPVIFDNQVEMWEASGTKQFTFQDFSLTDDFKIYGEGHYQLTNLDTYSRATSISAEGAEDKLMLSFDQCTFADGAFGSQVMRFGGIVLRQWYGGGIFGISDFQYCKFGVLTSSFYYTRFAGAGSYYTTRFLGCTSAYSGGYGGPGSVGVFENLWFESTDNLNDHNIMMWDSDLQFGEGCVINGCRRGITLWNSTLLIFVKYAPFISGSSSWYSVHALHGSKVRITQDNNGNTPAMTGGTADVAVGEAPSGTSSWAIIHGGTPLADATEMCYVKEDTVFQPWY